MWKLILEPNLGSLNTLLGRFGFESLRHNWLGDEGLVLYVIVVVAIWQQIGLYVVIYCRAAEHRPDAVRGRPRRRRQRLQQRSVTVPMLRPVTLLVITLNLLNGIKLFDVIWVMTEGGPVNASQVLGTYMYRVAFASPGCPTSATARR